MTKIKLIKVMIKLAEQLMQDLKNEKRPNKTKNYCNKEKKHE